MEPIRVELRKREKVIIHRCQKCGYEKPNKSAPEDDFEQIIQLMKNQWEY